MGAQVSTPEEHEQAISFRPLARSDFARLQQWLSSRHVFAWWREPFTPVEIERKFGPRVDGTEPTRVFVIEYRKEPIGFIQWYRWSDYLEHAGQLGAERSSAGIDLAIGESKMVGVGVGPAVIGEFLRTVVSHEQGITSVVTDPEEHNRRSVRAFEKAGFVPVNRVQLKEENFTRLVLRIDLR